MLRPALLGVLGGIVFFGYSVAILEAGKSLGENAAEPLYYCSEESVLFMASGTDATNLVVGVVVDPLSEVRVGCNSPGELLERDEIAVPSVEHLLED